MKSTPALIILSSVFISYQAMSQTPFEVPLGTPLNSGGQHMIGEFQTSIHYSTHRVFQGESPIFTAPVPAEIASVCQKTDDPSRFFIILTDGQVYEFVLIEGPFGPIFQSTPELIGQVDNVNGNTFRKIAGDAIYAMDANSFHVSRDTARTWEIDTLGLNLDMMGEVNPVDFAIDSMQNVYVTTKKGLYKQHTDSSRWYFVDSVYYDDLGETKHHAMGSVFVNRAGVIFASPINDAFNPFAPQGIFVSTDNGTNWLFQQFDSNEFPYKGDVSAYGDDAFGNLYAIQAPGDRILRSSDLGENWTRIDTPITNRVVPTPSNVKFFTSISGDTLLYVTTVMGLFVSSDQGSTWQERNEGLDDELPLGLTTTASGTHVYSGTMGLFTREEGSDDWVRTNPMNRFQQFGSLSLDGQGSIYTLAEGTSSGPRAAIKSTDGGSTWEYDTLGISGASGHVWYVDETGTQHLAQNGFGPGTPPLLYSKTMGGSWALDTVGFSPGGSQRPSFFFSDRTGNLYVGGFMEPNLWRRPLGGGVWELDTTGVGTVSLVGGLAGHGSGPFVFTSSFSLTPGNVFRKSGNSWEPVPAPPARAGDWVRAVSVDSTGRLYTAYQRFFSAVGGGVYSTTDNGTNWEYHALDSLIVNQMVSFGSTTYALTTGRGLYDISSVTTPTSVEQKTAIVPQSPILFQNYPNPFNPSTAISFALPSKGPVRLALYNILGQEIAVLFQGDLLPGTHTVTFDASDLVSGTYFYRIEVNGFVQTRKLIYIR